MSEVTNLTRSPVEELRFVGERLDPAKADSITLFSKRVAAVEAVLKFAYKMAALAAKRSETPEQEADVWRDMNEIADSIITILNSLKGKFPDGGTPELYDLALDYKLAAEKRYSLTLESIKCQNLPMPEGLFPQTT